MTYATKALLVGCFVGVIAVLSPEAGLHSQSRSVVVLKFATHPALDELEENFVASLRQQMSVEISFLNANGNPVSAKQLAEVATRPGVDLIVSLATPATQAVAKTPSDIPLLYAAVADPDGAQVVLARSTGIQNAGPAIVRRALQAIKLLVPSVRRVGTVYNPTEQNSLYVQRIMKEECSALGLQLVQRAVSDPAQLQQTIEQLRPSIDVLYSANDNLVNKGALTVARTAEELKLPFVIGELSAVAKGPVAGIGVEYASMGRHLGDLAAQILRRRPGDPLPPREGPPAPEFWINLPVTQRLGLTVPRAVLESAQRVVQ